MKKLMFLFLVASLFLLPAIANADRFDDCDRHHKGYLTYKEANRCFGIDKKTYKKMDKSGNGKVSKREFRAYQDAQRKKHKGWRDWF
jgi:hypothetical protein